MSIKGEKTMRFLKCLYLFLIFVCLASFSSAETYYPYAEISATPKAVKVGEPVLIKVTGYDNYDVELISIRYSGVWQEYKCEGIQKECTNIWEIKPKRKGSQIVYAYVRDNAGNYPKRLFSTRFMVYDENASYFEAAVGRKKTFEIKKRFGEERSFYYYDLNIGEKIYSLAIKAIVKFRQEDGYARVILRDSSGIEYLVYETYPLASNSNYLEVTGFCEETCVLNGVVPKELKIQVAFAEIYIESISYSTSLGIVEEDAYQALLEPHKNRLKYGQQIVKMETVKENMKEKQAYFVPGLTPLALSTYQEKRKFFGGEVPVLQGVEYALAGTFSLPEPKKTCECTDDSDCPENYLCRDCACVSKEPPCVKKTCSDYPGRCGPLSDGCGGTINCECPAGQICEAGQCKSQQPGSECIGCYNTIDECKEANGSGVTRICDCKEAVFCNLDTKCNCFKFGSCINSACGSGCVKKTCSDYPGRCGPLSDGCGGTINCECPAGQICEAGQCKSQPVVTCQDSDGKDIYTSGTVTYNGQTFSDYCEPYSAGIQKVLEYYCDGDKLASSDFDCPLNYTCLNGRCTQPSASTECKDSDGQDIYTKGTVEFNGSFYIDMCSGDTTVIEHYCGTDNQIKYFQQNCPSGYKCVDGACKQGNISTTCTETDNGKNPYLKGITTDATGSYVDKCSSDGSKLYEYYCVFDSANLEEISAPQNYVCKDGAFVEANPSSSCSDSDGGLNIFAKGTVNENGKLSTDECTCGGSRVKEYSCYKGMTAVSEEYCPTGYTCKDGACVEGSSSAACNDTDGGKNFSVKGSTSFGGNVYTDFCNGSSVVEYYCQDSQGYSTTYNCPYGCSDGICLAGGSTVSCKDSDGDNPDVKGTVIYNGKSYTDYCINNTSLNEFICDPSGQGTGTSTYNCPNGCSDGACK